MSHALIDSLKKHIKISIRTRLKANHPSQDMDRYEIRRLAALEREFSEFDRMPGKAMASFDSPLRSHGGRRG